MGKHRGQLTDAECWARRMMGETASTLAVVRARLWAVHEHLGEGAQDEAMGEGLVAESVRFSLRGAIECVNVDHLDSAIRTLDQASKETPASLAREWRARRAARGEE